MTKIQTPLRYPGGKKRLSCFMGTLIKENNLQECVYVEPFAGGCGLALDLLDKGLVTELYLNDIEAGIASFWNLVLNHCEEFCEKIQATEVSITEWLRQKELVNSQDPVEKGFATFFLNRTNRSGILKAGPIGGKEQKGKWKLDCRFNKEDLISRIRAVSSQRDRIRFSNLDASVFLEELLSAPSGKMLLNLDPPYFVKGKGLYLNHYNPEDHKKIAERMKAIKTIPWVVSYDNHEFIRSIYSGCPSLTYSLAYSAHYHTSGEEIIFFGNLKKIPSLVR